MTTKFHFIAGLPRSGSTLLAALLRQNPRFHAAMSSPLARMTSSLLVEMGGEDGPLVPKDKRRHVLRRLFDAFYAQECETREVVFDTNRGWGARLPLLVELFGTVRMICMVRSVASVVDSFETLVRRNVFDRSGLFQDETERATVYSRADALLLPNRTVGYALASLKDAFYGAHADALLVVEYDHLVKFPRQTLSLIYRFLGEEPFDHRFDSLEYDEPAFDAGLATPGLHFVKKTVKAEARPTVLPPDLYDRLAQLDFWRQATYSEAHVIRSSSPSSESDADTRLMIAPALAAGRGAGSPSASPLLV
ncbi:sulfotransferase [Paraburkholderia sp. NMBU_R16]|uniref:sulfotransferase family protein n=1 Tax=Paraburkholderia sp. NMBU_R16 TaxID=2698676 RepID=UPI001567BE9D|nr:sulfotransferase [Paraburkholderia sp. NMBU_R16]